jgi:hypothetical protein
MTRQRGIIHHHRRFGPMNGIVIQIGHESGLLFGQFRVDMTIFLPTLAVAYAGFCVWLAVRIVNRRERWAKWMFIGGAIPIVYIASFGPACWICSRTDHQMLPQAYRPIGWLMSIVPRSVEMDFIQYASAGMAPGSHIVIPVAPERMSVLEKR